ncbi:hypothetical protein QQ045_016606 [Rhodiola kirilowii]
MKYIGIGLFIIGNLGNFYHNHLLANIGQEGTNGFKIPKGGLFSLVVCPVHITSLTLLHFGALYTSHTQTLYALAFAVGTTVFLAGRSWATRKWYLSKLENFPKNVKCLIPFVF